MPASAVQLWAALVAAAAALAAPAGTMNLLGGTALSAAVLVTALLLALRAVAWLPMPATARLTHGTGLRTRTRPTRVTRLNDPDAAGRPRPRAPSRHPLAS